jgi:hypothetical protein
MASSRRQADRKRTGPTTSRTRDKRDQLPAIGPELAVSGSDSAVPPSQDPAKTREFLGWSRVAAAKSLQPRTSWRCGESRANSSPGAESLLSRENAGNSAGFRAFAARRGPENGPELPVPAVGRIGSLWVAMLPRGKATALPVQTRTALARPSAPNRGAAWSAAGLTMRRPFTSSYRMVESRS